MWPFRRRTETRSTGTGYTAQLMGARAAYIAGVSGIGELTATVQACAGLWEGALTLAGVEGAPLLDRASLAVAARALAFRGEAVFHIDDRLTPAVDWDLTTRNGVPRAYRLSLPEMSGNRSVTALAAEVLHFRIAPDPGQPWTGQAPLRRASLTAGLLQQLEVALGEVWANAPLGSQVVPFPESPDVDMDDLARGFRGQRGRVLIRESVQVTAAGGPAPAHDWKPQDVTPNLGGMLPLETLEAARGAICAAYGVLPAMFRTDAQGPAIREAQRHLAQWTLQPVAAVMAEECAAKFGGPVSIDVMRPLQAFDQGNRARAVAGIIEALAMAKAAELDPAQVAQALSFVNWDHDGGTA